MKASHVFALFAGLLIIGGADAVMSAGSLPATFDLDSTKSTYPFVMRLQGTMELQGDSLVIEVRSGVIRSAIPAYLGEQGIARDVQIAFGLGEKTTKAGQRSTTPLRRSLHRASRPVRLDPWDRCTS